MSTQPQPDPGPHLRHDSHQQLPVRPASNSDTLASSSTMQDHRHTRRTAPGDSESLQQQRQAPIAMDTAIPPTLPGADPRESRRRGVGIDLAGKFESESSSRGERSQPTHHGDSGFASGETDTSPPTEGASGMLGWKMTFRSSGESAASGAGDGPEGAPGEIDRESTGSRNGTHKSASEDWFNAFNRDVGGNNCATFDGTDPSFWNSVLAGVDGTVLMGYNFCVIDDPPYYLPNAYKKSNLGSISKYTRLNKFYPSRSSRAGMKRLHPTGSIPLIDSTEESNSDSFRSVIDDLTIKSIDQLLPTVPIACQDNG